MSKMRVYEYAKQNNMTSKEVLAKLKELNIDITNHMATITPDIQQKLNQSINKSKQQANTDQKKVKNKPSAKKSDNKTRKPDKITYSGPLTVSELATKLNIDTSEIIKNLMFLGVMATKNQDLDDDAIELICEEYGVDVEKEVVLDDTDLDKYIPEDKEED